VPFLSPAASTLQANKHGSEIENGPALLARRDERAAVFFADFMDGADVRVIQCRGGPRFSPEAFQRLRPSARSPTSERASTARHFERSRPTFSSRFAPAKRSACAERNLSSPCVHSAPAELFHNSVVGNGLPEK
jgi:hypothetical protein